MKQFSVLSNPGPYLEAQLVPGVELLRAVCYSLARVDAWCMAVQAGYNVVVTGPRCAQPRRRRSCVRLLYMRPVILYEYIIIYQ